MQYQDTFKVTGNVVIRRYDENGIMNLEREHKNLVVTAGKQLIAARLFADTKAIAIPVTSIVGSAGVATVTFAAQPVIPYEIGSYITIGGAGAGGYAGSQRITELPTTTSLKFDSFLTTTVSSNVQINGFFNGTVKTMKIGDNNTVANLSDTALGSVSQSVNLFSRSCTVIGIGENASVTYIAAFPSLDWDGDGNVLTVTSKNITEAALVNESNIMLCRTVFPIVTKSSTESLAIIWTVTIN
jgi:hypothetical protein